MDFNTLPRNPEPKKCIRWHSYSWGKLREFDGARRDGGPGGGGLDDDDDGHGGEGGHGPASFSPLLKLVEGAPQNVLQFPVQSIFSWSMIFPVTGRCDFTS